MVGHVRPWQIALIQVLVVLGIESSLLLSLLSVASSGQGLQVLQSVLSFLCTHVASGLVGCGGLSQTLEAHISAVLCFLNLARLVSIELSGSFIVGSVVAGARDGGQVGTKVALSLCVHQGLACAAKCTLRCCFGCVAHLCDLGLTTSLFKLRVQRGLQVRVHVLLSFGLVKRRTLRVVCNALSLLTDIQQVAPCRCHIGRQCQI